VENDSASHDAAKAFAANAPNWLLIHKAASAALGPLADQFTQNAVAVHLIALAFDLSREPAEVLVFSDNTDIHKALRQLIHPRSAQYRRAR
jgi:hypothetical protein